MPVKVVEIPGFGNVEFPDSMSDSDIGAAISKNERAQQGVKNQAITQRMQSEQNQPTSAIERGARAFGSTVMGAADAAMPIHPDEMFAAADALKGGDFLSALHHYIRAAGPTKLIEDTIRSHIEQGAKAIQDLKAGRNSEAVARTAATLLPVAGPMAANLADQAAGEPAMPPGQQVEQPRPPDVAGAAGTVAAVAAMGAAPKLRVTASGLARTAEVVRHPVRNMISAGLDVAAQALKPAPEPVPPALPPPPAQNFIQQMPPELPKPAPPPPPPVQAQPAPAPAPAQPAKQAIVPYDVEAARRANRLADQPMWERLHAKAKPPEAAPAPPEPAPAPTAPTVEGANVKAIGRTQADVDAALQAADARKAVREAKDARMADYASHPDRGITSDQVAKMTDQEFADFQKSVPTGVIGKNGKPTKHAPRIDAPDFQSRKAEFVELLKNREANAAATKIATLIHDTGIPSANLQHMTDVQWKAAAQAAGVELGEGLKPKTDVLWALKQLERAKSAQPAAAQ